MGGSPQRSPVISSALDFFRREWKWFFLLSALAIIPCVWQKHIANCDLASHTYNVWLLQLLHKGQAPGLYTVPQYSNVLFDWMLQGSIALFGFSTGERIATAASVLIFFWSLFALCSAAAGRAAWNLVPFIAMLSYGWMFEIGFFNNYLSIAFAFLVAAIALKGRGRDFVLFVPLALLLWLAHPLGSTVAVGLALCMLAIRRASLKVQILSALIAAALVWMVCRAVRAFFVTFPADQIFPWLAGADQLIVYEYRYLYVAAAWLLAVVLVCVLSWRTFRERNWSFLILYLLMFVCVRALPDTIMSRTKGPMGFLPDRFSVFTFALACVLLASLPVRRWHTALYTVIAIAFFAILFRDHRILNRMEDAVHARVQQLPAGSRAYGVFELRGVRISPSHIVDRACIGHCFSYNDYEPAVAQFRLRVHPRSPIATSSMADAFEMQEGVYVPQPWELPLYVVYRCGPKAEDVCLRESQDPPQLPAK